MKKIEKQHIDQIKQKFASIQNKEDLVSLLSEAKNILYGKGCKPFELKSLTYYANPDFCKKRYSTFTIKKKSGGERTINAPIKGLKSILRSLNFILQCVYEPHNAATGFVVKKSIVDNAKVHVGNNYVYNLDLKDFFHSFDRNRVKMGFIYEPFNLNRERESLAFLLASLCTHPFEVNGEIKNVLPQGSPTSPTITNILCKKLDRRLTGLAKRYGAKYTRYADDITFSSPQNIYNDEDFIKELERIIGEDNILNISGRKIEIGPQLIFNTDKTRLQKSAHRQEVTGLIVNDKVNVRKRYVKQIRMWLYYWEKYGYEKAQQIFIKDYIEDKGHVKKGKPNLIYVLDGKLEFLKMVKGVDDRTYKGLQDRLEKLSKLNNKILTKSLKLENGEINSPIGQAIDLEKGFSNDKKEVKCLLKESQLELIIRQKNTSEPVKLLMEKFIPEGTYVPYSEVFENLKIKNTKSNQIHNPKKVVEWLNLFRNGYAIKYSNHLWDGQDSFNSYCQFIEKLQNEFVKYRFNEMQNYSSNLYWKKLFPFLFQKELTKIQKQGKPPFGWGQHNIKIGWQYPDLLKNWCAEHFDYKGNEAELPFSMKLPSELRPSKAINGKTVVSFEDIVNLFKKEIEFRDNDLFIAVKSAIKKELNEYEINETTLEQLKGCSFYTNTEYVIKAVTRILWMIKSRSESRRVQISCTYKEDSKEYNFQIIHLNSFSDKEVNHPKLLLEENSGDLFILRETLQSLCDFSITSRFKEENNNLVYARIDYLYDGVEQNNWKPKIVKIDEATKGFTFNLTFPML